MYSQNMNEFSEWAFNRFVEAIGKRNERMQDLAELVLRQHLEINLKGSSRRSPKAYAKELLQRISAYKENPQEGSLLYVGNESIEAKMRENEEWRKTCQTLGWEYKPKHKI